MNSSERATQLKDAYSDYEGSVSTSYDDVLKEVIDRVARSDAITKLDIGALIAWKRLRANTRWVSDLMATPDALVRETTATAVARARDASLRPADAASAARTVLTPLPGFKWGDAIASAVCFVAAPHRLAVYDRRAHRGLERLGYELDHQPGRYGRYIDLVYRCVDNLAASGGATWTAREVDLALFQLGR